MAVRIFWTSIVILSPIVIGIIKYLILPIDTRAHVIYKDTRCLHKNARKIVLRIMRAGYIYILLLIGFRDSSPTAIKKRRFTFDEETSEYQYRPTTSRECVSFDPVVALRMTD